MKIDMRKLKRNFERYEKQAAETDVDRTARNQREQRIDDLKREAHGFKTDDPEWEMRFYSGGM